MDDVSGAPETATGTPVGAASRSDVVLTQLQDQVLRYAKDLRTALARSRETADALARTHLETVAALAAAVDVRDEVTGGHVYRVANYGVLLADVMAPELRDDPQLIYGFLLHDIGKLAVPDGILNKDGALDEAEYEVLKTHVSYGVRFIKRVSFLRPALNIIATHHESWDGTGYPQRLRGAEIPLGARMFAVCDALDAMLHDRPYRRALTADQALSELRRVAGVQFDPEVVDAVEHILPQLLAVPDHPPIPGLALDPAPRDGLAASTASNPVFEALDHAVVVLGPDGRVIEANGAFTGLFGLDVVPVGLSLRDVLYRTTRTQLAPDHARDELRKLELDLFQGRRAGVLTLPSRSGRVRLRWHSNLIDGQGAEVAGRVIVFEPTTAPSTPPPVQRDLDDLAALLDSDPSEPGWQQRAQRAQRGLERVRGWAQRLADEAEDAAVRGDDWRER